MRKLATAALVFFTALAVTAANPHFVVGPTVTQNPDGSLTVSGSIAGLGNADVTIILDATADVACVNRGGHRPPGHFSVTTTNEVDVRPENGRANFAITAAGPVGSCPNPMRTEFQFVSAVVTVVQNGQTIFQQSIF